MLNGFAAFEAGDAASTFGYLLKLCPKFGIILVLLGLLCGCRIVLDEPSEVLGVVDFVVEHLFAAGGVMYQLVSFFCWAIQADFIKKIQAKGGQCLEKEKGIKDKGKKTMGKRSRGKDKRIKIRQQNCCLIEYGGVI